MREFKISRNDGGQRLDKFLLKALPALPPSLVYKSIRTKKIKVNRHRAEPNQMLAEGDVLQLFLAEHFFPSDSPSQKAVEFARVKPHLDIVYEDDNLLLLHKKAGMSVHDDESGTHDHLLFHIQAYLFQKGEYHPDEEYSFAPALCHRIDRNTDGLVMAAKNAETLRVMSEKIRQREIEKIYLCVLHGVPKAHHAILEAYHTKDEKTKKVRIYTKNPPPFAKKIKTEYQILQVKGNLSLAEIRLHTGRTHQIRAHMAHIGHALLGEGKYAQNRTDKDMGYTYQALCAWKLTFSFASDIKTHLDYLRGKTFAIDKAQISFLSLFSEDELAPN